jgi:uncharacterized protein YeaO (DUF488 family)
VPVRTKRVYDPPAPDDGERILVMRLWPRGVPKDAVDRWERDLGPSRELLQAYRRGQVDWPTFARRYRAEMAAREQQIEELARRARRRTITLLCGCADASRCHRTLLQQLIEARWTDRAPRRPKRDR